MSFAVALAGTPNCGKTTLFNALTGSRQSVGNWPGVTVEKRAAEAVFRGEIFSLVDLPGTYSLTPYSMEERVTRDYLAGGEADCILCVLDATHLQRGLYLLLSVLRLGIPVVAALNMMDDFRREGGKIRLDALSEALGCAVVGISARKKEGLDRLWEALRLAVHPSFLHTALLHASLSVRGTAERTASDAVLHASPSVRGTAEHTVSDAVLRASPSAQKTTEHTASDAVLHASPSARGTAEHTASDAVLRASSSVRGTAERGSPDDETALYERIEALLRVCGYQKRGGLNVTKADRLLTGKYTAFPCLILVLLGMFFMAFGLPGQWLSRLMENMVARVILFVSDLTVSLPMWARSLISDGVLAGAGSVLCFLPQVLILYFFMAFIEESGYMARAALITDKILRRFGLSGRSVIPLIMGFGCTTAAAGAVRGLENERDRRMTAMLMPCMSCGAKLPVYALLARAFFAGAEAVVVLSLYALSVLFLAVEGHFLNRFVFHASDAPFVLELPPLRMPTLSGIGLRLKERAADFVRRAGSVIVLLSAVTWLLRYFSPQWIHASLPEHSILAWVSGLAAGWLRGFGFGSWQAISALVSGFAAKESIISCFQVLFRAADVSALIPHLRTAFSGAAGAYSFLVFILLSPPCFSALSALSREIRSKKLMLLMILTEETCALLTAFLAYRVLGIFI